MPTILADSIRTMIIQGELRPGQRVIVNSLVEMFRVSPIPIREALRLLQAEGLLLAQPQRGVTVAPVTWQDLQDLYDFRRLIEPELAVRTLSTLSDSHIIELRSALHRLASTINDQHSDNYMAEHTAFHWALVGPATTALLRRTIEGLWQMSERYIRLTVSSATRRRLDAHRHESLVTAIESGDEQLVRHTMTAHLSEAQRLLAPIVQDLTP
jgi:DNA-binding GntR family transcriptional regulator